MAAPPPRLARRRAAVAVAAFTLAAWTQAAPAQDADEAVPPADPRLERAESVCAVLRTRAEGDGPRLDAPTLEELKGRPPGPVTIVGADLAGADLRGLDLTDALFVEGSLAGAKLFGTSLTRTAFLRTNLAGLDLEGAQGTDIALCEVDASRANLRRSQFPGLVVRSATLTGVDAGTATLDGLSVQGAELEGASFAQASLRDATFACFTYDMGAGCLTAGETADFSGADLSGAWLSDLPLEPRFTDAELDGVTLAAAWRTEALDWLGDLLAGRFERLSIAPGAFASSDPPQPFTRAEIAELVAAANPTPAWRGFDGPSFDCAKAGTDIERAVCGSSALAQLDRILADTYALAREASPNVVESQRAWARGRAAACPARGDETGYCLIEQYQTRLAELLEAAGPAIAARIGNPVGVWGPADEAAGFAESFRGTPLFARFAALYRSTTDLVTIETAAGREMTVEAGIVGGNYHVCSFGGRLVLNAETGWFQEVPEPGIELAPDPFQLAIVGPWLLLRGGSEYCGARASWRDAYVKRPS